MLADGLISFEYLWYIYKPGFEFYTTIFDHKVASEIVEASYVNGLLRYFLIRGNFVQSDGKRFFTYSKAFPVYEFEGSIKLEELPVKPLTAAVRAELMGRGRRFRDIAGPLTVSSGR